MENKPAEKQYPIEALYAMANGDNPAAVADVSAVPEQDVKEESVEAGLGDVAANQSCCRKPDHAAMACSKQKAHAIQFRKMMIPVLLAVGLLLIILGACVGFVLSGQPKGYEAYNESILKDVNFQKWLVWISFPLGLFLLFGSWFFNYEVRKMLNKEK